MGHLFRQQAIAHKNQGLQGEVLVIPRISLTLIVIFLSIWVVLAMMWLATRSYARKETVLGWLEPPEGIVKVYPQSEGIITDILVTEGSTVEKDQPLLVVNGDKLMTDGQQLESLLLSEYQQQHALLTQQLERSDLQYSRQRAMLEQEIQAAKRDLQLVLDQMSTMRERISLVDQQLKDVRLLTSQGHASSYEEIQAKQQQLTLTSELQSLTRAKVAQENSLESLQNQYVNLPDEHANRTDQLKSERSRLTTEIALINARRAYVIKAPRAGTVNNLLVKTGNRPSPSTPLLSIVPEHSQLSVHLLVPVSAAGFVNAFQRIEIRFDAFPYQKYGLYDGQITGVSDAVLLPTELQGYPVQSSSPVYTVFAQLASQTVISNGKAIPLKAGMTLSADIELENRSLIQWLLEPLFSLRGRL